MSCYICKKNDEQTSEYELKVGGQVDICFVCENTYEYYLRYIKREMLIDGVPYDVTSQDEKIIKKERKLRERQEEEEAEYERLVDSNGSIFYLTNQQKKNIDYDHQVLRYVNSFLGVDADDESHIQRLKFNYIVAKHWHLDEWDGLSNVHIWIDQVSKKIEKPEEKEWRERTRRWYRGKMECDEDFYNVTFGFSQYNDEPCGDIWIDYSFICSKSYKLARLIRGLLMDDGWKFK